MKCCILLSYMVELNKSDFSSEYKMSGNSFSYGSMMELDGANYDWSRSFLTSGNDYDKAHLLEDDLTDKIGKHEILIKNMWIMNIVDSSIDHAIAYYTTAEGVGILAANPLPW